MDILGFNTANKRVQQQEFQRALKDIGHWTLDI